MTTSTADPRTKLLTWIAERAGAIDSGTADSRDTLHRLAQDHLLPLAAGPDRRDELPALVTLIEQIAAECMTSAFTLWAHRMVIDYLAHAGTANPEHDRAALRGELASARTIGSTGLAPALRELAGLGAVPLTAQRHPGAPGELRISGSVEWASNLYPGAVVVVPVRLPDDEGRARGVVAFRIDQPGVTVHPAPRLLALNATASSSMTLDGVHIAASHVLTEDLASFVATMRPRLLLTQSAFCLGVAHRSIVEAREHATGIAAAFTDRVDTLTGIVDDARRRLHDYAARNERISPRELLTLRLDAAVAAGDSTRLELCVQGGSAYAVGHATNRRLREAAFLPVQAPTEGLVRQQLADCA